jgi:tetratricopeptide (TPR) repeat protein
MSEAEPLHATSLFMGCLPAIARQLKYGPVTRCALASALFLVFSYGPMKAQNPGEEATLRGAVRDSEGKPVADAIVHLRTGDKAPVFTTRADSQGNYGFRALHDGVYTLRAEMAGYADAVIPSLFLGPKETKNVDVTLLPAQPRRLQPADKQSPEFFDEPQFTVAGVTDTTSLGGHGSDTIVRTRESLAKEVTSLAKMPAGSPTTATSTSEKSLREGVEHAPRNFEANHRLGRLLVESGRAPEAIPYLERAAELNPGDYENAYELALANADAGLYARARDHAQTLLLHHNQGELHHLLGDVQEKLGNPLASVGEYQRAAELDPSEAYLFDWGSELLLHHAPEPAVEVFSKGNRLFPSSVRMLIGLGSAWFARGSYDRAVQRICEASDLNPNDSIPYIFLGRMQRSESASSPELAERLHRFATLHPESAQANYYYAVSLWKQRKSPEDAVPLAQAESLLTHAVQLDPNFGDAYLQLGILHFEHRDMPKAVSDFQQAIRANPQMEEPHYRLAQAYRQAGDADKAKAELQIYDEMAKGSAQKVENERREIRQFVYTLRDQPPTQAP